MKIVISEKSKLQKNYYGRWYQTDWNEVKERLLKGAKWNGKCLEWRRSERKKGRGYGAITINQKRWLTHRAMWRCCKGEIPHRLCVLHKCDNPKCINIDHLFLGTLKDNADDMAKKGRRKNPNQWGERNPVSKLTFEKVNEIRKLRKEGCSAKELSYKYGISDDYIYILCKDTKWGNKNLL